MVGSIFDPDDKIATNLGSKSTTENIIVTRVISATGPDLLRTCPIFLVYLTMALTISGSSGSVWIAACLLFCFCFYFYTFLPGWGEGGGHSHT